MRVARDWSQCCPFQKEADEELSDYAGFKQRNLPKLERLFVSYWGENRGTSALLVKPTRLHLSEPLSSFFTLPMTPEVELASSTARNWPGHSLAA